jgi:HlyD family secretion protein
VLVAAGKSVKAGDVLVRFDDALQRAAVDAARHTAAQAAAALADLQAGTRAPDLARARSEAAQARATYESTRQAAQRQIDVLAQSLRQAGALVTGAEATARNAAAERRRAQALYASGDQSAQVRDAAVAQAALAEAQLQDARAAAAAARAQLANARQVTLPKSIAASEANLKAAQAAYRSLAIAPRPGAVQEARAALAAAQADLAGQQARLAEQAVVAPAPGMVASFDLHVGDLVAPGAAVATIDEAGEPYVRVFIPQAQLGRINVGDPASVRSDADPGIAIPGTVEMIDQQAQFTPQSVQTADDRATLAFGVKVRIHDRDRPMHGGTTATVTFP